MFSPKSTTQITFISFGLVVIPLFIALIYSVAQLDNIDSRLSTNLENNNTLINESQNLYSIINGMERGARQYQIVRDLELIESYNEFEKQLIARINTIKSFAPEASIAELSNQIQTDTKLVRQLVIQYSDDQTEDEFDEQTTKINSYFTKMRANDRTLSSAIQDFSKASVNQIIKESKRVKKTLFTLSILLIPVTLLLMVYFSHVINKPISQIKLAIEKIGKQYLDQPIKVSGPKNLQVLGRRLEWLRVQLKELDTQKTQFLQHVSHELKTPLTAIREGTELLNDKIIGELNDKQLEVTGILKTNSKELQNQIEDLLKFNKSIAESNVTRRMEIPIDELIHEAIDEQKLSIKGRRIRLRTSLKNVLIKIDPEQMLIVFRNLLSNAIKYTPPGGEIKMSLKEKKNYVEFHIQDSGTGIHEDEKENIFTAFFKGEKDGTGYMKGTGLGLAIVKQYIDFHKGEVLLLDSAEGALFRVRLPL